MLISLWQQYVNSYKSRPKMQSLLTNIFKTRVFNVYVHIFVGMPSAVKIKCSRTFYLCISDRYMTKSDPKPVYH